MARLRKSCEEKHFTELWIAVSYFALESIVEWCSANIGVLWKAILEYSSSEPPVRTFEMSVKDVFLVELEA